MPRDRTREAFLKAIEADPLDATPRLIYADWLNDYGFDDEAHEQQFQMAIMSDPYRPGQQAGYATWLAGQSWASPSRRVHPGTFFVDP